MKIKCISRSHDQFTRSSTRELYKTHTNIDPVQHPLEAAREYKRALNAAKLEKVFAKPFLTSFDRHEDAVSTLLLSPNSLSRIVSGGHDGQIVVWDVSRRRALWNIPKAHGTAVHGLTFTPKGERFLSCGQDKTIHMFRNDIEAPTAGEKAIHRHSNKIHQRQRITSKSTTKSTKSTTTTTTTTHDDDESDNNSESETSDDNDDDNNSNGPDIKIPKSTKLTFLGRGVDVNGNDDNDSTYDTDSLPDDGAHENENEDDFDAVSFKQLANPKFLPSASPVMSWHGKTAFLGIDFHHKDSVFATCGAQIDVWDVNRSNAIHSFEWGPESMKTIRFNAAEPNIFAAAGSDNSVVLYDIRLATPTRKVILAMRTNKIAWNPMEPINFALANEDSNVYMFDMRKLDSSTCVHRDHVAAVVDVCFAPTGLEFVSGGYDKTIRIFPVQQSRSREVYHTKRMGRITCVAFTGDAKYVLSGSDDHNIRLWKAEASMPIRPVVGREKRRLEYAQKLKERHKHLPEIRRIIQHRHVPRAVFQAKRRAQFQRRQAKRKIANVQKHSTPGSVQFPAERSRNVVRVVT